MKKLVILMVLIISFILMGYGFYQMYLDTYVRPNLGFVGFDQYPDPLLSLTIAISGVLLLFGLYLYTYYEKELTAWKEERCPHCGGKIH